MEDNEGDSQSQFSQAFQFQTEDGESQLSQNIQFIDDEDDDAFGLASGAGLAPTQDEGEGLTFDDDNVMGLAGATPSQAAGDSQAILPSFNEATPYDEGPAIPSFEEAPPQDLNAPLSFVDDYPGELEAAPPAELPPWRCEFCNIHTPAAVVKCVATGKWFCNHKQPGLPASCIVYHLVKSRNNEVMLHKESPLGEITLECFLTGGHNVFQLGFVVRVLAGLNPRSEPTVWTHGLDPATSSGWSPPLAPQSQNRRLPGLAEAR
jgi:hypothetical protein